MPVVTRNRGRSPAAPIEMQHKRSAALPTAPWQVEGGEEQPLGEPGALDFSDADNLGLGLGAGVL